MEEPWCRRVCEHSMSVLNLSKDLATELRYDDEKKKYEPFTTSFFDNMI